MRTFGFVVSKLGLQAWRQVLPEAIDLMVADGDAVYSVSGEGSTIQKWDARQGFSKWEASVYPAPIVPPTSTQLPVRADASLDSWFSGIDAIVGQSTEIKLTLPALCADLDTPVCGVRVCNTVMWVMMAGVAVVRRRRPWWWW